MVRLDDEPDDIDKTLSLALVENKSTSSSTSDNSLALSDPLASSTWEKVGNVGFSCLRISPLILVVFWVFLQRGLFFWGGGLCSCSQISRTEIRSLGIIVLSICFFVCFS